MLSALLVAVAVAGVPAAAQLAGQRAAPAPAQVSLDPVTPAFTVAGMVPGDVLTRCFTARNEGSEPIDLADAVAITGTLAPHLRVVAVRGTGTCAAFTPTAFAFGTNNVGVAPDQLRLDRQAAWAPGATRLVRISIFLPESAPADAMAKTAAVTVAFAGAPRTATGGGDGTPAAPGGIAPGTTGGFDRFGNFLTNSEIKKRLRVGRARLRPNGDVVVTMLLPAGGAIRAKAILPNGVYYAHTLLPEEWGPTVRIVLKRREIGRVVARSARRRGRALVVRVTTRYRWAHGDDAFVQPEQKLKIVRRR